MWRVEIFPVKIYMSSKHTRLYRIPSRWLVSELLKLASRPYSAQISSIRRQLSLFEPDITLERQCKAVLALNNRYGNSTGIYSIYSLYMLYFVQVKLYNF